jgi:hypothetical protein
MTGTFQCETADQCRLGSETGVCEMNGFCSFADPGCASGRRYDSLAGGGLGGTCTSTETVDAAVDIADAFDPAAQCPASYGVTLPGSSSRYRIIATTATYWAHHATCVADLPGATHPLTLDNMQEATDLAAHLADVAVDRVYIGGVQDPAATAVSEGFIALDGTPLIGGVWHLGETPPEPNDNDAIENQQSQLVLFDRLQMYVHDAAGPTVLGAACECDGKPIATMAQQFIDADPVNPN